MIKRLTFILSLFLTLPLLAQSEYISVQRDKSLDFPGEDDNMYGIIIAAKHYDLVINIVNIGEGQKADIKPPKHVKSLGIYEYEILTDVAQPKVEINRRGNVYKTDFIAGVKRGHFVGYSMEEVANPIRMDDQTTANDAILDEEKAELEFTTSLENLQIECEPQIVLEKKSSKKDGDRDLVITSIIIPIQVIKSAEKAVEDAQKAFDEQDKYLKESDNARDEEWETLDELEKALHKAQEHYSKLVTVYVYCDNSNRITLDISDMGPRSKKCYVVLPLIIEKEIYKTDCSLHMSEGGKLFDIRKFKEAKVAFENALNAKDATEGIKSNIKTSIALCDSCIRYESLAAKALRKINQLKESGSATQNTVADYTSAAIDFLQILNAYKPDEFYSSRIEKLENILNNMPLCITFTVVEWKTLHEGNAIADVEIWAYNGTEAITASTFSTDKRFRKAKDKNPHNYTQIGVTNYAGKAKIELNRNKLPKGLIFRPVDNDDVKIYYLGQDDLMRRSNGSYMERQFRLKMFTK